MDTSREQKAPLTGGDSSSSSIKSPSERPQAQRKHFLLNWTLELSACVMFVAALIALFVTLYQYRDRPSPDWPTWLSLNSIVAIYMVLLKSCVLLVTAEGLGQLKWSWFAQERPLYDLSRYDAATRGPWGALRLIWRLRHRDLLASLGALVTLLTLFADPFAQQIVHFYDCSVVMEGISANMPRNAYWGAGGNRMGPGIETITPPVQQAISAGLSGSFGEVRADCLTGNCTWTAEYSSLGWAGFCNDISDEIRFYNRTYIDRSTNTTVTEAITMIQDSIWVNQSSDFIPFINYASMGLAPVNASKPANSVAIDFLYAGNLGRLKDITTGREFECDGEVPSSETWKCRGSGAARCWAFPSVKVYNSSVQAGQLEETIIDADNAWDSDDGLLLSTLDTHCINDAEREALIELGYNITDDERWLGYKSTSENLNMARALNDSFPDSLMKRGCQYVYWQPSIKSIQDYMATFLNGTVYGIVGTAGTDPGNLQGDLAVRTIFNWGNVSFDRVNSTFWNVSQALDNHIRQDSVGKYSDPALGQVNEEKTCIRIQWGWIAYPATLVVLALIFFLLMVWETRPVGATWDMWKSSPLALLYHGLLPLPQKDVEPGRSSLESIKEMEAHARRTVVTLGGSLDRGSRLELR